MGRTREGELSLSLARLVSARLKELGMSYQDAATEGGISKSAVAHLATRPLARIPRASTLLALSTALRLPVLAIQAEAARSVGLRVSDEPAKTDPHTETIVALLPRLSLADRATVARMVEGLLAQDSRVK